MSDSQLFMLIVFGSTAIVWTIMYRCEVREYKAFQRGYERGRTVGRAERAKSQ
jgi:hypothetical protein